ncbi:endoribonuclease [Schizosaccharomyces cryophilus OY26]|uniref:Diphthine--ammonia ligase n=1 Tax=Schizosaccharomyces cryophilus (strain OY26 / ATCC MYA-4695 / CBS 11777 / NBRC 106824 / NRRL Y48691) TaxID=653667 RepID=S9X6S6_SCHCR|nr:endoribonuclease [Schizosaccharomyces cryophilus OY26]EPY49481.1 endoribonuclease [Schizosaccharomyces cryophilus OY26]
MKVVGLISGGKDSCYNLMHCVSLGHEIIALGNLYPAGGKDEIDSFMYQCVGHDIIPLYAECLNLPLYREEIRGSSIDQNLEYSYTINDETEDLYRLLKHVLECHPDLEAVSTGAILSTYQRTRVENVCKRLGLVSLSYLWQMEQTKLLDDMIQSGLQAVLIKVAAIGLTRRDLNKTLGEMQPKLMSLKKKFDLHPCGEGGEYETLVLDCPLFQKKIVLTDTQVVEHSSGEVCYLKALAHVEEKPDWKPVPVGTPLVPKEHLLESNFQSIYETILNEYEAYDNHEEEPVQPVPIPVRERVFKEKKGPFLVLGNVIPESTEYNSFEEEADSLFQSLEGLLAEHSYSTKNVCFVVIIVSSMNLFSELNGVYQKYFNFINPPSRSCIASSLSNDHRITLSCIATDTADKRTLHIQGQSYWAPANIGPYSQSNSVHGVTFISGQIGLIPSVMDLQPQDTVLEAVLSLQHIKRVSRVMKANQYVACLAYIKDSRDASLINKIWSDFTELNNIECPLSIALVEELPRNASVEWQVLCCNGSEDEPAPLNAIITNKTLIGSDAAWTTALLDRKALQLESSFVNYHYPVLYSLVLNSPSSSKLLQIRFRSRHAEES